MKILIYGAGQNSFIGSALVEHCLAKGWTVANVSRSKAKRAEVTNYAFADSIEGILAEFQPDKIIYVSKSAQQEELLAVNVQKPLDILAALKSFPQIEFVYLASGWQFGDRDKPDIGIDLYACSKKALIPFLDHYNQYTDIQCQEIALHGTYGMSDGRGKVLEWLLNAAVAGESVALSPGEQYLNLCHIDAVCEQICQIMATGEARKYQIVSEKSYKLKEIVALIQSHRPFDAQLGGKPYRPVELMNIRMDPAYEICSLNDQLPEYIRQFLLQSGV